MYTIEKIIQHQIQRIKYCIVWIISRKKVTLERIFYAQKRMMNLLVKEKFELQPML